jgi:aspartate carbamoyltransferase catalytic subunit
MENLVNSQASSVAKGETLPDTIRVMQNYVDAIVLRHPEMGAAATAAKWARVPILNAGNFKLIFRSITRTYKIFR